MTDTPPPTSLRALKDAGVFEIAWPDGKLFRLPFKSMRCDCPCAMCLDEITNVQILRPESIPEDIRPIELGYSGNYALKVTWSDQHNSGIFTWDRLRRLCEQAQS